MDEVSGAETSASSTDVHKHHHAPHSIEHNWSALNAKLLYHQSQLPDSTDMEVDTENEVSAASKCVEGDDLTSFPITNTVDPHTVAGAVSVVFPLDEIECQTQGIIILY